MPLTLAQLDTPAALIDIPRMQRNVARMQHYQDALGVALRPHVKTSKCLPVIRAQLAAGAQGITVSTLKEAEQCFADGITDILYAVGMAEHRLPRALALRQRGCRLTLLIDSAATAEAIAAFGRAHGETFDVWIEIDTDDHRSGIKPEGADLLDVAQALSQGGAALGGVLTHAGSSYELNDPEALAALAERERAGCVRAAARLREAGFACPVVSVGSTPTALAARNLDGVTEVRAGVYVFFDLVMHNVGVCKIDELALSVLGTVIGHQAEKGWALIDAGWMAMSRDRGTQRQQQDFGYGQICSVDGTVLTGYQLVGANQEHSILAHTGEVDSDIVARFPVGSRVRILPNHACATGAQFGHYYAIAADGGIEEWSRLQGW